MDRATGQDSDAGREEATTEGRTTGLSPASRAFGARFTSPMLLGAALNPLNSSVIATALVSIAAAMHVPVGRTSILISCLYLTSAIAQPAAGRLAEELGPRRVFLAGILIVLAGGIVGGAARDMTMLVLSRVLIGLGTSAGYPSAMLLIRRRATAAGLHSPPGSVLGALAIAAAVTITIGPTAGGLLVGWFNWRAAFLVNVPMTAVALAMALAWIPPDPERPGGRSAREVARRVDPLGVIGFGGAMTALLVFLLSLPRPDWIALVVAVAVAVALVAWELRAANPFLDVRLLASNGVLTRTYLRNGLTLLGVYVILYGLTQWIEVGRGLSAYQAGLVLIPMGACTAISARVASHHVRLRLSLTASALLLIAGAVGTLFLDSHSPLVVIVVVTGVFGLAAGSSTVTNQTALYRAAPPQAVGTASGLLRTFGYAGSIASATITGLVFRVHVDDAGLHKTSLVLIATGIVVLLLTALDRGLGRPPAPASPSATAAPRLSGGAIRSELLVRAVVMVFPAVLPAGGLE